jgi:hypothetical protein
MVAGVETDGSAGHGREFADRHGLTYPILLDNATARRALRGGGFFSSSAVPFNVVLDRRGAVRYRGAGFDPDSMGALVEKLLRE